jgi:hypothetical protein
MNIESYDMQYTLEVLCNSLENKPKVYYPRFGDGDFNIMSNNGRCIEHEYSEELQKELQTSFCIEEEGYLKGAMVNESTFNGLTLQPRNQNENNQILSFFEELYGDRKLTTYSHVLLTYAAVCEQELMINFLDNFIRPKKKLFIGSVPKKDIEKLVGNVDYYVNIPVASVEEQKVFKGAYYTMDKWWDDVMDCVDDVELVLPTAGMAGRVTCGRLWNLDKQVHCIELGSIVDAVIAKESRSWIVRAGVDKINNLLIGD